MALGRLARLTKGDTDPDLLAAYTDLLEEYAPWILAETFARAERTCKFFPAPAELIEIASEIRAHDARIATDEKLAEMKAPKPINPANFGRSK